MNDIPLSNVTLEVIYIISAVLTALIVPFEGAKNERAKFRGYRSLKYYLTYGHIIKGILLALIPFVNTVASVLFVAFNARDLLDELSTVNVFKEKKVDE